MPHSAWICARDTWHRTAQEYHSQTTPLLKHYEPKLGSACAVINGNQKKDQVWADIDKALPAKRT